MRLVGDGDTTGGGLPLPVAFEAVVQELLDCGTASFSELTAVVTAKMSFKEARILGKEGAWRTWEDFTRDILSQLSGMDDDAVPVLASAGNAYRLAPGFTPGARYRAIKSPEVYFTVWDEKTRLEEEKRTRSLMNARRILADIEREAARDSDEVWPKVLKLIRARVSELGDDSEETRVMALANSLPSKRRREKREGPPQRGRKEWQQATGWNDVSDPFGMLIREFYDTNEDNFLPVTAQDVRAYVVKRLAAVEAGTPWAGVDVSPGAITGKAGTHQGLTGLEREGFLARDASRRPILWARVREV